MKNEDIRSHYPLYPTEKRSYAWRDDGLDRYAKDIDSCTTQIKKEQ